MCFEPFGYVRFCLPTIATSDRTVFAASPQYACRLPGITELRLAAGRDGRWRRCHTAARSCPWPSSSTQKEASRSAPTLAEQLIDVLRQASVEHVYGVIGDSLDPVVDAIRRQLCAIRLRIMGRYGPTVKPPPLPRQQLLVHRASQTISGLRHGPCAGMADMGAVVTLGFDSP